MAIGGVNLNVDYRSEEIGRIPVHCEAAIELLNYHAVCVCDGLFNHGRYPAGIKTRRPGRGASFFTIDWV